MKTPASNFARLTPRHGVVTVEMALCLPILFLVLFGCYEICRATMLQHAAESAAYEAARAGVIPGATEQRCKDAGAFVLNSMGIQKFRIDVEPRDITAKSQTVTVEIRVPMKNNTLIAPFFFDDPVFLGSCELVREIL